MALITIQRQRSIVLRSAKYQTLDISMIPKGVDEYWKLVAILDEKLWEYHTFQLPEEKTLRIVIKEIPEVITEEEVKEDLLREGFHPIKASRLIRKG